MKVSWLKDDDDSFMEGSLLQFVTVGPEIFALVYIPGTHGRAIKVPLEKLRVIGEEMK